MCTDGVHGIFLRENLEYSSGLVGGSGRERADEVYIRIGRGRGSGWRARYRVEGRPRRLVLNAERQWIAVRCSRRRRELGLRMTSSTPVESRWCSQRGFQLERQP